MAWQAIHDLRAAYQAQELSDGKKLAQKVLQTFHTCPIPEIARLGRTLRRWKDAFLAYSHHKVGLTTAPQWLSTGSSNSTDA